MEVAGTTTEMATEVKTYVARFRVIYLHSDLQEYLKFTGRFADSLQVEYFDSKEGVLEALKENYPADVIVAHADSGGLELLDIIRKSSGFGNIPFVLTVDRLSREAVEIAGLRSAQTGYCQSQNFYG